MVAIIGIGSENVVVENNVGEQLEVLLIVFSEVLLI